jgi:hypothetical protein
VKLTRNISAGLKLTTLADSILLAGCATAPAPAPEVPREISRQLPPEPDKLAKPRAVPYLDTQCHFPWYGVAGCKGKDACAMLRLTVSDNLALRSQVSAVPAWYEGVRKSYGAS